jgi:hypothetical protein
MSPHITAGASLGVEDVGVLRDKLVSEADLTAALEEYEADRLPRYRQSAVLSRAVEVTETPEDFEGRPDQVKAFWCLLVLAKRRDPYDHGASLVQCARRCEQVRQVKPQPLRLRRRREPGRPLPDQWIDRTHRRNVTAQQMTSPSIRGPTGVRDDGAQVESDGRFHHS